MSPRPSDVGIRIASHTRARLYTELETAGQSQSLPMPLQGRRRASTQRTSDHSGANPLLRVELPVPAPLPLPSDIVTPTQSPGREVSTEPATPSSLTPHTRTRALRRERNVEIPHSVLHYDRTENGLQPWYWCAQSDLFTCCIVIHLVFLCRRPVNEAGERVTPSNLLQHRHSHEFLGPCCLCASLESDGSSYTEASIFVALSGPTAGQYTAACATGQCRYWGRFRIVISDRLSLTDISHAQFPSSISIIKEVY